jgi:hypothetical protein
LSHRHARPTDCNKNEKTPVDHDYLSRADNNCVRILVKCHTTFARNIPVRTCLLRPTRHQYAHVPR